MDAYDLSGACAAVRAFLDALTNWYIRRSRDRFWAGDQDAIDTLHTVLARAVPHARAAAAAHHRGGLPRPHRRAQRAPHRLARRGGDCPPTPTLVAAMDLVRDVCSSPLRLRKANGLRVRQPLAALRVAVAGAGRAGRRSST